MNEQAHLQLIRARTALYIEHPMYGILALRLTMVEEPSIPTLAVNHLNIYYNPDYVLSLSASLTKSAIAHEVMHVVLAHLNRCGSRNMRKWNAAADYVVNPLLKDDNLEISPTWLYNAAYVGMTTDHVYALLPDDPSHSEPDGSGSWGAQDEMKPDPAGSDPSMNQAAAEELELDWEVATIGAAKIAASQGKLPASMKRFIDDITNNKVNWKQRLRRFATDASKKDYSWARPQRRMLPYGYILPSLHSEAMGLLVNVLDTSGSIDDYTLNLFGSEITAMWSAMSPEKTTNIYCDAKVQHVDSYDAFQKPQFKGHGGGGTDFRPPFQYIAEHGLKPACFIYLTDGYGSFPEAPPPYPVLWVMTTDVVAPWGETIRIEA